MQNLSFHTQRRENVGTQEIHQDHWSLHVHLSQCHLLHNEFSLQKKFYIGETGRSLGDRFQEHLRERNDTDASKPVARHRLLPTFTCDLREKIRARAIFTNQTFNLCDIVNMFPCWPLCRCNFYNLQRQTRQCVVWASIRRSTRPKNPAAVLGFHPSGSQRNMIKSVSV